MNQLCCNTPAPHHLLGTKTQKLVLHLRVRVWEILAENLEVLATDEQNGILELSSPKLTPAQLQAKLQEFGVQVACTDHSILFYLNSDIRFEDMDFLWGCFAQIFY